MSIDALIQAHTEALIANTAALTRNSDLKERIIAGQQAAIDKIEAPKQTRTRKAAEPETPAAAAEQPQQDAQETQVAATPAAEPQQEAPAAAPEVSDDDVKNAALKWMADVDPAGAADLAKQDIAKRRECATFLMSIVAHFGYDTTATKLTGPTSKLTAEQRKAARFFIQRKAAGLPVDFTAAYDFTAAPDQGGAEADPLG